MSAVRLALKTMSDPAIQFIMENTGKDSDVMKHAQEEAISRGMCPVAAMCYGLEDEDLEGDFDLDTHEIDHREWEKERRRNKSKKEE